MVAVTFAIVSLLAIVQLVGADVSSTRRLRSDYYRSADIWPPSKPILFRFSDSINEWQQQTIKTCLLTISAATCVRFRQYSNETNQNDTAYMHFVTVRANYCDTTNIGYRKNDRTIIRMGPVCFRTATIYRLIFHALGLFNEQQRGDRDKFIYVSYENVMPRCRTAFDIVPMDERVLSARYDFDSILHWDNRACAKWPNITTIEAIKNPLRRLGSAISPSAVDYQKLSNLYCNGSKPFTWLNENPDPDPLPPLRQYIVGHMTVALWQDGVIYYVIDDTFLKWQRSRLERAIKLFNEHTCVKFTPKPDDDSKIADYVEFTWNKDATSDGYMTEFYGFIPGLGKRVIELGERTFSNNYGNTKLVYWALMALLGVTPEHRRPDRDKHIVINWPNIADGMDWAFQTYTLPVDRRLIWTPYDLASIMHPVPNFFSRNPRRIDTIMSRNLTRQTEVGSAIEPTKSDYAKVNNLYCYGDAVMTTPTTTTTTTEAPTPAMTTTSEYYYEYYEVDEAETVDAPGKEATTVKESSTTSTATKPFVTVFPPFEPNATRTLFPTLPTRLATTTTTTTKAPTATRQRPTRSSTVEPPSSSTTLEVIINNTRNTESSNDVTTKTAATVAASSIITTAAVTSSATSSSSETTRPPWYRPPPVLNFTLDSNMIWSLTKAPEKDSAESDGVMKSGTTTLKVPKREVNNNLAFATIAISEKPENNVTISDDTDIIKPNVSKNETDNRNNSSAVNWVITISKKSENNNQTYNNAEIIKPNKNETGNSNNGSSVDHDGVTPLTSNNVKITAQLPPPPPSTTTTSTTVKTSVPLNEADNFTEFNANNETAVGNTTEIIELNRKEMLVQITESSTDGATNSTNERTVLAKKRKAINRLIRVVGKATAANGAKRSKSAIKKRYPFIERGAAIKNQGHRDEFFFYYFIIIFLYYMHDVI